MTIGLSNYWKRTYIKYLQGIQMRKYMLCGLPVIIYLMYPFVNAAGLDDFLNEIKKVKEAIEDVRETTGGAPIANVQTANVYSEGSNLYIFSQGGGPFRHLYLPAFNGLPRLGYNNYHMDVSDQIYGGKQQRLKYQKVADCHLYAFYDLLNIKYAGSSTLNQKYSREYAGRLLTEHALSKYFLVKSPLSQCYQHSFSDLTWIYNSADSIPGEIAYSSFVSEMAPQIQSKALEMPEEAYYTWQVDLVNGYDRKYKAYKLMLTPIRGAFTVFNFTDPTNTSFDVNKNITVYVNASEEMPERYMSLRKTGKETIGMFVIKVKFRYNKRTNNVDRIIADPTVWLYSDSLGNNLVGSSSILYYM